MSGAGCRAVGAGRRADGQGGQLLATWGQLQSGLQTLLLVNSMFVHAERSDRQPCARSQLKMWQRTCCHRSFTLLINSSLV